jgi:hypothetical protein
MTWHAAARIRLGQLGLLLALLANVTTFSAPVRGADDCLTQEPGGRAYRVVLCIAKPVGGASVSGAVAVSASVTVEGALLGVRSVVFYLDDAYLLTDFEAPYEFVLPSDRFVDGPHALALEATLRDDLVTDRTSISLTFSNGITAPPQNHGQFVPRAPTGVAGRPFIVAAVGDGAGGETASLQVTDLIKGWDPALLLYLGDVYEQGTPTEFLNWYGTRSEFYGQFREITNPTIGDHEFEGGKAPGYFDYWDNVPLFYSFDAGGWHFVSVDATGHSGSTDSDGPQYRWLDADLAAHTGSCILVFFHRPVFSIGPHGDTGSMRHIWALLRAHSVALVLSGNDHEYQRWEPLDADGNPDPDGVIEMVVGTGGHAIKGFAGSDPRMVAGFDDPRQAYGALRLQLGPRGAAFAFENVAQTTLDGGAFACPGSAPDAAPPSVPTNLAAAATGPTRATLSWAAASDDSLLTGYIIERDGTEVARTDSMTTTYEDRTLQPEGSYAYSVRSLDIAGNESERTRVTVATSALATVRPIASIPASGGGELDGTADGQGPSAWLVIAIAVALLVGAAAVLMRARAGPSARG